MSGREAKTEIFIGLNEYILQLSCNKDTSICTFCEWKNKIISAIDDKINNLKTKIIPRKVKYDVANVMLQQI